MINFMKNIKISWKKIKVNLLTSEKGKNKNFYISFLRIKKHC